MTANPDEVRAWIAEMLRRGGAPEPEPEPAEERPHSNLVPREGRNPRPGHAPADMREFARLLFHDDTY